ncbi:MAG TPA: PepSY domain-containing protein [Caulobacteraceae bacterium]
MKRTALIFAILAVGAGLPGMADAQGRGRDRGEDRGADSLGTNWRPQQEEARAGVRQGRMVPLEAVVPRIARRTPGRMVDTGIENRRGQVIYRVRWQSADGRRIDYLVDAATGAIIGADGE